jgi:hypothetical protein
LEHLLSLFLQELWLASHPTLLNRFEKLTASTDHYFGHARIQANAQSQLQTLLDHLP